MLAIDQIAVQMKDISNLQPAALDSGEFFGNRWLARSFAVWPAAKQTHEAVAGYLVARVAHVAEKRDHLAAPHDDRLVEPGCEKSFKIVDFDQSRNDGISITRMCKPSMICRFPTSAVNCNPGVALTAMIPLRSLWKQALLQPTTGGQSFSK